MNPCLRLLKTSWRVMKFGNKLFSCPIQYEAYNSEANDSESTGFSCGDNLVDNWFAKHAKYAKQRGTAVVYVSYCKGKVAGFYTLSSHSVVRNSIQGGWLKRNSPEQVPAILLGMMGVDTHYKGCGLGAALLRDAIKKSLETAQIIGAKALLVDPSSKSAEMFYAHFGFKKMPCIDSDINRMYLLLKLS